MLLTYLLRDVEQGAEITISRGSRAVARLVPMPQQPRARPMGFVDYELPDSFFDELPEEQLAAGGRGGGDSRRDARSDLGAHRRITSGSRCWRGSGRLRHDRVRVGCVGAGRREPCAGW